MPPPLSFRCLRHVGSAALAMGCALALLCVAASASSADRIRVVLVGAPGEPSRPAFVEQLRIQLAGAAHVAEGPVLPGGALSERLDRASALLEESGAGLAVWVERAPAERGSSFVLYAVSRKRDVALVKVERLEGTLESDPDIDRSLALKVGTFLDGLLAAGEPDLARALAPPAPALAAPPAIQGAPPTRRARGEARAPDARAGGEGELGPLFELGATGALASGSASFQAALCLGGGAGWERGPLRLEGYAALRLPTDLSFETAEGRVDVDETAASAGLRGVFGGERLAAGPHLELGARLLDAVGLTGDGRSGRAFQVLPVALGGAEARLGLRARLDLRVAAGLEIALARQRFALEGIPIADLGRLRPAGTLSLVAGLR